MIVAAAAGVSPQDRLPGAQWFSRGGQGGQRARVLAATSDAGLPPPPRGPRACLVQERRSPRSLVIRRPTSGWSTHSSRSRRLLALLAATSSWRWSVKRERSQCGRRTTTWSSTGWTASSYSPTRPPRSRASGDRPLDADGAGALWPARPRDDLHGGVRAAAGRTPSG